MKILFLCVIILLLGCNNKKSNFELLSGINSKDWDYCGIESKKSNCFKSYKCGYGFSLSKDKSVRHYRYSFGKRIYSNTNGDIYYCNFWDVDEDTFNLGENHKLIKLNQDTLIFIQNSKMVVYVKSNFKSTN